MDKIGFLPLCLSLPTPLKGLKVGNAAGLSVEHWQAGPAVKFMDKQLLH